MDSDGILILCATILLILTVGEPDLLDAIILYLTSLSQ